MRPGKLSVINVGVVANRSIVKEIALQDGHCYDPENLVLLDRRLNAVRRVDRHEVLRGRENRHHRARR